MRAGLAQRARIVLLADEGVGTNEIVHRVGVSKPTVIAWKKRYAAEGIAGLDDRPKPGRPAQVDEVAVVLATLEPPPERLGVTHWSSRLLAEHLGGISNVWVARIWRKWGLQPWRRETFKFSTDPELEAKVRDVVGLYLDPPEKAVVLSIDEKSPDPGAWTGPRRSCRCGPGLPEKATHDYVRHGTTTLFAALEIATGKITDACYPRHRHDEFLKFLKQVAKAYPRVKLHLVVDNYATHKHPSVQAWLAEEPADHDALHADLGVLAEHGRDLLRDHHPAGDPPRHLHQRQRPHRRHRDLHRRLERTLPAVHLDQDRRRNPHQSHRRSKIIVHTTLGAVPLRNAPLIVRPTRTPNAPTSSFADAELALQPTVTRAAARRFPRMSQWGRPLRRWP